MVCNPDPGEKASFYHKISVALIFAKKGLLFEVQFDVA